MVRVALIAGLALAFLIVVLSWPRPTGDGAAEPAGGAPAVVDRSVAGASSAANDTSGADTPRATPERSQVAPPVSVESIEIVVFDESGARLAGVELVIVGDDGESAPLGATDASGVALVRRSAVGRSAHPPATLLARLAGFATAAVRLPADADRHELVLTRGGGVDIRAVDPDGRALADARLERVVRMDGQSSAIALERWETAGDAWIRVRDLAAGVHRFRLAARGHSPRTFLVAVSQGAVAESIVRLESAQQLVVRVIDEVGSPVRGATVVVEDLPVRLAEAATDAGGTVRFDALSRGESLAVSALHDDYRRGGATTYADRVRPLEIVLARGAALEFLVTDARGAALPGRIVLEHEAAGVWPEDPFFLRADAETPGRVTVPSVPAGRRIQARFHVDGGTVLWHGVLDALAAGERRVVDVHVPAMARLDVRVRDASGRPLRGSVRASSTGARTFWENPAHPGPPPPFHAVVDAEGRAVLWVQLGVLHVAFHDATGTHAARTILVEGDGTLELVTHDSRSVTGVLVDGGGEPLSGWIVSLGGHAGQPHAVTGRDGRFRIARVARAGVLLVEDPLVGPVVALRDVEPGRADLRVVHERVRVHGTVVDARGPLRSATISVEPQERSSFGPRHVGPLSEGRPTSAAGAFTLDLPDGAWRVHAHATDGRRTATIVEVGSSAPVPLELSLPARE